jgi:anthranilate synthase/aminodeoxychorismate synthase-like glutamine amidotransferase
MILVIDNYDSFTYNLVQYLQELGAKVEVCHNDATDCPGIAALRPSGIVISPGPGNPEQAGITLAAIRRFSGVVPILGVCLGHQAIAQAAIVVNYRMMHGKVSRIFHDGRGLLKGMPMPFAAARYHSLVVDPGSLPESLEVSARSEEGEIMGIRHRQWAVEGVQFHPESILTERGKNIVANFVELTRLAESGHCWGQGTARGGPRPAAGGSPLRIDLVAERPCGQGPTQTSREERSTCS